MERETNRKLILFRESLRSKYNIWNHSKKSGVEHLPEEPKQEDIKRVADLLLEEISGIQEMKNNCESLLDELRREISKIKNEQQGGL